MANPKNLAMVDSAVRFRLKFLELSWKCRQLCATTCLLFGDSALRMGGETGIELIIEALNLSSSRLIDITPNIDT